MGCKLVTLFWSSVSVFLLVQVLRFTKRIIMGKDSISEKERSKGIFGGSSSSASTTETDESDDLSTTTLSSLSSSSELRVLFERDPDPEETPTAEDRQREMDALKWDEWLSSLTCPQPTHPLPGPIMNDSFETVVQRNLDQSSFFQSPWALVGNPWTRGERTATENVFQIPAYKSLPSKDHHPEQNLSIPSELELTLESEKISTIEKGDATLTPMQNFKMREGRVSYENQALAQSQAIHEKNLYTQYPEFPAKVLRPPPGFTVNSRKVSNLPNMGINLDMLYHRVPTPTSTTPKAHEGSNEQKEKVACWAIPSEDEETRMGRSLGIGNFVSVSKGLEALSIRGQRHQQFENSNPNGWEGYEFDHGDSGFGTRKQTTQQVKLGILNTGTKPMLISYDPALVQNPPPIIELFTESKTYKSSRLYELECKASRHYELLCKNSSGFDPSSAQSGDIGPIFYPLPENEADRTYFCVFCHSNQAPPEVYLSHPIRVNDRVVCPTLRCLVCKICGKTGDLAHTMKYCPENAKGFFANSHSTKKTGIRGSDGKFMLIDNQMVFVPTASIDRAHVGKNESSKTGTQVYCSFGDGDQSLMGLFQQEVAAARGNNVNTSSSAFARNRPSSQ